MQDPETLIAMVLGHQEKPVKAQVQAREKVRKNAYKVSSFK